MKKGWKKYKIKQLIIPVKESVEIDINKKYKQVKVRLDHKGVELRKIIKGSEIGSKQYLAKEGQFIISKIDARNRAMGIIPTELDNAIVTNDFPLFEFTEIVDKYFFDYYAKMPLFDKVVKSASEGTTNRRRLKLDKFYNLEIELPPLPEQKRIVKIIQSAEDKLQKINALNKEQERDIKNILYSSYIDLVKDAAYKPMAEVAPIIRRPVNIIADEQYPELGIRCFGNGTFHKPALSGIEVGTKKIFQIKTGDLVFSNVFAWEGGIAIAKKEDNNRFGSHRFISCNCDLEKVKPSFLNFHFLSPKGLEEINNCSPGGAGRNKTLGLKKLEAIKVPVPSIDKQEQFEKLLNQFEDLQREKISQAKSLTQLIPSLLDKAFKGELYNQLEETKVVTSAIPTSKKGFAKQVLGGKIVSLFKDDGNFTNIKF